MKQNISHFIGIFSIIIISLLATSSCQESLQEKAEREAHDYTRKYCPTPAVNYISTDSVAFNTAKNTFCYYCTFSDKLDDPEIINLNKDKLKDVLIKSIRESTQMKPYVEAGVHFHYFCHSKKNPNMILFEMGF